MKAGIKIALVLLAATVLTCFGVRHLTSNKRLSLQSSPSVGRSISNLKWTDCDGTGNKYFTIKTFDITGDFSEGSDVEFVATGVVNLPFTHASTDIKVTLNLMPMFNQNEPNNPPQSYTAGPITIKDKLTVSISVPSGNYNIQSRFRNDQNTVLQCLQATFRLF